MSGHRMQYDHSQGDWSIEDPGDAGAISTALPGVCMMTSGASGETRTCADPTYVGQWLTILMVTDGGGDIDVTFASQINSSTNTIAAFDDVDDQLDLIGIKEGTSLEWRVVSNRGSVALT